MYVTASVVGFYPEWSYPLWNLFWYLYFLFRGPWCLFGPPWPMPPWMYPRWSPWEEPWEEDWDSGSIDEILRGEKGPFDITIQPIPAGQPDREERRAEPRPEEPAEPPAEEPAELEMPEEREPAEVKPADLEIEIEKPGVLKRLWRAFGNVSKYVVYPASMLALGNAMASAGISAKALGAYVAGLAASHPYVAAGAAAALLAGSAYRWARHGFWGGIAWPAIKYAGIGAAAYGAGHGFSSMGIDLVETISGAKATLMGGAKAIYGEVKDIPSAVMEYLLNNPLIEKYFGK